MVVVPRAHAPFRSVGASSGRPARTMRMPYPPVSCWGSALLARRIRWSICELPLGLGLTLLMIWQRGIDFTRRAPALVVFITLGTTGALWLAGYLAGVDVRESAVVLWLSGGLIAAILSCYGRVRDSVRARRRRHRA